LSLDFFVFLLHWDKIFLLTKMSQVRHEISIFRRSADIRPESRQGGARIVNIARFLPERVSLRARNGYVPLAI